MCEGNVCVCLRTRVLECVCICVSGYWCSLYRVYFYFPGTFEHKPKTSICVFPSLRLNTPPTRRLQPLNGTRGVRGSTGYDFVPLVVSNKCRL